jgi:hypothetical protein
VSSDGSITIAGGINGNFLTVRLTSLGRIDRSFGAPVTSKPIWAATTMPSTSFVNPEGILVAGVPTAVPRWCGIN